MKKLIAIGFVWLGCAIAWAILGSTIVSRSGDSSEHLEDGVTALWGGPLVQRPPTATHSYVEHTTRRRVIRADDGSGRTEAEQEDVTKTRSWSLVASDVHADIRLTQRRKGLLWFPTYAVAFKGRYTFAGDIKQPRTVSVRLPMKADSLADLRVVDAMGHELGASIDDGAVTWKEKVNPGVRPIWTVSYRTRGLRTWRYAPGPEDGTLVQADHFALTIKTDTPEIDFPPGTLSPTSHHTAGKGWIGRWRFHRLVTRSQMGVELYAGAPHSPSPSSSRVSRASRSPSAPC